MEPRQEQLVEAIRVDPEDAAPLWRQIEVQLRTVLACGAQRAGSSVPSVRALATLLEVNPATVIRAYRRLVDDGVLEVRRGQGTFVARRSPVAVARERQSLLDHHALDYAGKAMALEASPREAAAAVQAAWSRLRPKEEP